MLRYLRLWCASEELCGFSQKRSILAPFLPLDVRDQVASTHFFRRHKIEKTKMASVCAPETAMVQSNQQIPAAIYDDFIEISCLLGDDRDDTKPLDNLADTQHNLESSWHALPTVSTPASAFETQQVESVPFFSLDSQASSWPEEPARVSPSPSSHELMTSTNITNTSTDSDDSGNSSDSKKRNITEGGDIVERTARQKIRRR